jgi:hypothetical protein
MSVTFSTIPRTGAAAFYFLAFQYIRSNHPIMAELARKKLKIRLLLESPHFYPAVVVHFEGPHLWEEPLTELECRDRSRWDARMYASADVMMDYFLGRLGAVRPLLNGKIKPTNLFVLVKLLWFIKACIRFFSPNSSFATAVLHSLYRP